MLPDSVRPVSVTGHGPRDEAWSQVEDPSSSDLKSHLKADRDTNLGAACDITPAKRPEAGALPSSERDVVRYAERNAVVSGALAWPSVTIRSAAQERVARPLLVSSEGRLSDGSRSAPRPWEDHRAVHSMPMKSS